MRASVCSCESCEKAKTTRSTWRCSHELEQLVGPPELDARQLVALLERLVVDDAEQPDAVLGMQQVLARDQLARRGRRRRRPRSGRRTELRRTMLRPIARPTVMNRIARRPEKRRLLQVGMGDAGEPGSGKEDPGADGDEVEDADDVVGRRVIRSLLVAVVEAVELGRDHPRRQADHEEDEQLGDVGVDPVEDVAERDLRDDERSDQPDEVRDRAAPGGRASRGSAGALPERSPAQRPRSGVRRCVAARGPRGHDRRSDASVARPASEWCRACDLAVRIGVENGRTPARAVDARRRC